MPIKHFRRPIFLGIVGDSASGKTTLSAGVAKILGEDRCTIVCTDDYHRYDRAERKRLGVSALDPHSNYIDILETHFQALKLGLPVLKPVYNHDTGTLERPHYIRPNDYIIAEGLLGYTSRALRECFDVKIYLDPCEDLRIRWKLHRDIMRRGYTEEQVRASLERRQNDSPKFIHPQRMFADLVVNFRPPRGANDLGTSLSDVKLDVRQILRPTLPHPDFSPLFEGAGGSGLHLELARDKDGKHVDVLEISGAITDERAESIEELLWTLIPEASHLRAQVGEIDDANGAGISHPLALTQLIVSYHMVKAALDVHARPAERDEERA